MRRSKALPCLLLALALALGGILPAAPTAEALSLFQKIPDPQESLGTEINVPRPALTNVCGYPVTLPTGEGATESGLALLNAAASLRSYMLTAPCAVDGKTAVQPLRLTRLETSLLLEGLAEAMTPLLQERVETAQSEEEIFSGGFYRPELLRDCFDAVIAARLDSPAPYAVEQDFELRLRYEDGAWHAENLEELNAALLGALPDAASADAWLLSAFESVIPALPVLALPVHYTIPEDALSAPIPNPACYGETTDPAVIEALLQRPEAQKLIGDEKLVWNADIDFFHPDRTIRYYLDETILVLVWKEVEARGCGTFSEVFVADGSQLRRKIAGDEPFSYDFRSTSKFAKETNAVLALGGDFYHHGRACGISVYQREIVRFEPASCDVCYITTDGDMLFSYRNQIASEEDARRFIEENDVLFSLVFGPVLIDNGVDVTPEYYSWGEINDRYARSALGLLGRHHYLCMNINCYGYDTYYYLATLRQAADAMVARGCVKAYTLDGGQTATTVFNGQLINPVQFGWEKDISDIIYFATAVPNN